MGTNLIMVLTFTHRLEQVVSVPEWTEGSSEQWICCQRNFLLSGISLWRLYGAQWRRYLNCTMHHTHTLRCIQDRQVGWRVPAEIRPSETHPPSLNTLRHWGARFFIKKVITINEEHTNQLNEGDLAGPQIQFFLLVLRHILIHSINIMTDKYINHQSDKVKRTLFVL